MALKLTPTTTGSVGPGDTISFVWELEAGFDDLLGYQTTLSWNADELILQEISQSGEFFIERILDPGVPPEGDQSGAQSLAFSGGSISPLTGDADLTLATLTFKVVGTGDLDFTLDEFLGGFFIGPGNQPLNVDPITFTVSSNAAPVANDDSVSTNEDTAVSFDVRDNDTDTDPLTVSGITGDPSNGEVAINLDGTLTYTPDDDFSGEDSFTYEVSDGNGGSDTATVTVTVNAVNDAPDASDDTAEVDKDDAVIISVLANDTDVDGPNVTVTSATDGSNGTTTTDGTTVTYTPDPGYVGSDSFTYTIEDGAGGSDTATVTVTVNETNFAPVAIDDAITTSEDTAAAAFNPTANDTDADADTLFVASFTQGSNGSVENVEGELVYTPNANFNGEDSFDYTVSDGNGGTDTGTVTVTVNAVNDTPDVQGDAASTNEDTPISIDVLANDSDVEGPVTLTGIDSDPSNGTAEVLNGEVLYTPNGDFNGEDSFTYTVEDSDGAVETGEVTVTVNAVNDAPVAQDDSDSTTEDTAVIVDVLVNDTDVENDTLTVSAVGAAANGTLQINNDNTITYTPDANFNGEDSFGYTVSDGNGGLDTGTVTVTVSAVNDAPVVGSDEATTNEDTPVSIDVLANDSDVEGPVTLTGIDSDPSNGTAEVVDGEVLYTPNGDFNGEDSFTYTVEDSEGVIETGEVSVTVNAVNDAPIGVADSVNTPEETPITIDVLGNDTDADNDTLEIESFTQGANGLVSQTNGSLLYSPDDEFTGTDSFTYVVSDGNGATDEVVVTVNVSSVEDEPVAMNDTDTTPEDTEKRIAVLSNDFDADEDELSIVSVDTNGTSGDVDIDGTEVIFTPDANFNGETSFLYTITDGNGGFDTAEVTFDVTAVNDAPVAQDDSDSTTEDTAVVVDVLSNDTDVDNDTLTVSAVGVAANGTLQINNDNTITYTPDANFNGEDSFDYTVSDGNSGTDTGTVTITVGEVNDTPVVGSDDATTNEDTPVSIDVLANDSDAEGPVTLTGIDSDPSNGTAEVVDGEVLYTPNGDFNGEDSFTYTVEDSEGAVETGEVTVTVNAVNDAPVAQDDSDSTTEDTAVVVDVLGNDTDVENDTLTVSGVGAAANGTLQINNDNTITYTPDANFNGEDSFDYTVSDGNGGSDTATVTVTVGALNDVPVAVDDSAVTDEDTEVLISVLANDTDGDNDLLSVVSNTDPANGGLSLDEGVFTYTPNADFNGTDSFSYTITGGPSESTATVNITVNAVNDPPVAEDDTANTGIGEAVDIDILANDSDVDEDTLTVILGEAANGGLSIEDGIVTYTPDANFSGTDSFEYTLNDGTTSDTATVSVTVGGITFAPTVEGPYEPNEPIEIELATIDGFPGFLGFAAALTYDADVLRYIGTEFNENFGVGIAPEPVDPSGITTIKTIEAGSFSPVSGSMVVATFTFEAIEKAETTVSIEGDLGTFFLDINGNTVFDGTVETSLLINSTPIVGDDSASLDEDSEIELSALMLSNDTDGDGDTLEIISVGSASNGIVMLNEDGTVTYAGNENYFGLDSFEYTVSDGVEEVTATVNLTVNSVNDAPIITTDTFQFQTVERLGGVIVDVDATDVETAGLIYSLAGEDKDVFTIDEDTGEVSFAETPLFNDGGDNLYEFEVVVSDGDLTDSKAMSVEVLKDTDSDTIADLFDNAVFVANTDQRDTDGDGFGNVIDADFNGDFKINIFDLVFFASAIGASGLVDGEDPEADADFNGPGNSGPDGRVDIFDLPAFAALFGTTLTAEDSGLVFDIA